MAGVQAVAVPFLSSRIARRLHPMARKKKRKAKSGKGATTDLDVTVRLAPTLELIHEHISKALCDEVFAGVRTKERQRDWTLHCLARFWIDVIVHKPTSLTELLARKRKGHPQGFLPSVTTSNSAFFDRCKTLSSGFFMGLHARFSDLISAKAPKQYCRELAHLQKKFTDVVVFDGSRLDKVLHRLKILWSEKAAVLPGCLLAVYDLFRGITTQLWFDADAASSEFNRAVTASECLAEGTLVLGDRLYCTPAFFRVLNHEKCFGVFRRTKAVSIRKVRCLKRVRKSGLLMEDWLVRAGKGENSLDLRLVRLKSNGKTYEALTNVLDPKVLSAKDIIALYPKRWSVERMFYDLKVVLNLQSFYAANPNAVAMQVFAAAMVHSAFRIAQANIAKEVGLPPEKLSTEKLFPLLALASIKLVEAEFIFAKTCNANRKVKLRKPSWKDLPDTLISLHHIRVQRRSGRRKKRKFDVRRRNWKSFQKIRGGGKLT
jgi:hypothetical protein